MKRWSASPRRPARATAADGRRRRLLGEILLDEGRITAGQLAAALRAQADRPDTPLGQVLVEQGALTQPELRLVLERYNRTYRIGDLLVETNVITEEQLETALALQQGTEARLGDVLLALRYLDERDLRAALAKQFRVRFADLDEFTLDRGLARLIAPAYARAHRVVPVARSGDRLTVLMDDPADAATRDALGAATGREVEVVTTTAAAFRRAFTRVYGQAPAAAPAAGSPVTALGDRPRRRSGRRHRPRSRPPKPA